MTKDEWTDQDFAEGWDEAGNLYTNPDRLNQLSLLADMVAASGVTHLLDLGIGSAQVEAVINTRHADFFSKCKVIGIDHSAAMLAIARKRCDAENLGAVKLVECEFSALNDLELETQPDAVICVQALHEVPHNVKRQVFARVQEWLPNGQPFYILDRFEYPTEVWFDDWQTTWDWMRSNVSEEVLNFDAYHQQYSAKDDYIATVADYRDWLEQAGFQTLCPYQCFNRALIIARA